MTNKETILQAALVLFAEQGYDRTPTSQIARQAGVSEGLIFRHYTNKAGLLEAIIGQGMAQIADSMQPYEDAGIGPLEAIALHIERSFRLVQAHETFWRLAHRVRFQAAVQALADRQLEEVNSFIVRHLAEHFQKAGAADPATEALLLFALIDGITLHYLAEPAEYPLATVQQSLIEKYRHGHFLG